MNASPRTAPNADAAARSPAATRGARPSRPPTGAAEILDLLRSHGDRVTASRRAVVDALVAGGHHVTAEEIVARVAEQAAAAGDLPAPDAHRATVYRTLDRLEELGVVSHVHLGHGPSTFHLDGHAESGPHHHAVCSSCGAVVEVPLEALDALADDLRRAHGFELSRQHFALSGRCAACAAEHGPLSGG